MREKHRHLLLRKLEDFCCAMVAMECDMCPHIPHVISCPHHTTYINVAVRKALLSTNLPVRSVRPRPRSLFTPAPCAENPVAESLIQSCLR